MAIISPTPVHTLQCAHSSMGPWNGGRGFLSGLEPSLLRYLKWDISHNHCRINAYAQSTRKLLSPMNKTWTVLHLTFASSSKGALTARQPWAPFINLTMKSIQPTGLLSSLGIRMRQDEQVASEKPQCSQPHEINAFLRRTESRKALRI